MYTTPQQRSAMQSDRILPAMRSTRSAQAWSTLAAFLQPNGAVSCPLDRLLFSLIVNDLTGGGGQEVALAWYGRDDGGSNLLFLYPDHSALVASTTAPASVLGRILGERNESWNDTKLLPPHAATFSPVILRGACLGQGTRTGARLRFPTVSARNASPGKVAEAVARAVEDGARIGPVFAPWHAAPGDTVAPWATLGHAIPQAPAPEGAAACVQGLFLSHGFHKHNALRFQVLGLTVDDQGQPVFHAPHLRLLVNDAGTHGPVPTDVLAAFSAWMEKAWASPRAPWEARRWFAPMRDVHSRPGQAKARRVPAILLSGEVVPTSAHGRCAALAAYQESLAW